MLDERRLIAVCEGNPAEDGRQQVYQELRNRMPLFGGVQSGSFDASKIFKEHKVIPGYAKQMHIGVIHESFREGLDALEVSMICDGGYSHFGGHALYDNQTGEFSVTIYVD